MGTKISAAADGPDDFDLVAFAQMIPAVLSARHNLSVDLDGEPSCQAEAREQDSERGLTHDLSRFTIELNVHACVC